MAGVSYIKGNLYGMTWTRTYGLGILERLVSCNKVSCVAKVLYQAFSLLIVFARDCRGWPFQLIALSSEQVTDLIRDCLWPIFVCLTGWQTETWVGCTQIAETGVTITSTRYFCSLDFILIISVSDFSDSAFIFASICETECRLVRILYSEKVMDKDECIATQRYNHLPMVYRSDWLSPYIDWVLCCSYDRWHFAEPHRYACNFSFFTFFL